MMHYYTSLHNSKYLFFFFRFIEIMSPLIEDCLRIIFNQLKDDQTSLYSCILVNRFWCQIGVTILWKNPLGFGLSPTSSIKLYNAIIYLLPTSSKQFLI